MGDENRVMSDRKQQIQTAPKSPKTFFIKEKSPKNKISKG